MPSALSTEIREVNPAQIAPAEINARFMKQQDYLRLVENLKRDGTLTSVPLVYREGDRLVCVSGHHRVQAAVDADLPAIPVMVITTPLSDARRRAIQLSHNRIVGQDDPNLLLEMFTALDLDEKRYSGHTDDDFKQLESIDIASLAVGAPELEILQILFLPEDLEVVQRHLDAIKKAPECRTYVAAYRDLDRVFEAVNAVRKQKDVHNAALALRVMSELALERLAQLEAEAEQEQEAARS